MAIRKKNKQNNYDKSKIILIKVYRLTYNDSINTNLINICSIVKSYKSFNNTQKFTCTK